MKKSFLIIIGCIVSVIIFQAFTTSKEPHFKNLQILSKDISDHDLDSVMHHFSQSLGVRCNFCHVNNGPKDWDFASDGKPEKNIARKMMIMAIGINKNYFQEMDMDHDHDMKMDSSMNHKMMMMDTTVAAGDSKYMLEFVTCYTCHRGDAHPESKTPPHQEGQKPPPPAPDKK